ncbi:MAG: SsrA-binding protein, partial [Candidatus Eisenbacteria bacterium]|nr:SsrA-binding protein [Candidatus Eisenbacteria bacterium]
KAKIEIALARGKRLYDKREALARKDAQRDMYRLRSRRDD